LFPGEVRLEIVDPAGVPSSIAIRLRGGQLDVLDLDRPAAQASRPGPAEATDAPPPVPPRPTPEPRVDVAPTRPAPPPSWPPPAPPSYTPAEAVAPTPADTPPPATNVSSRGVWIASIGAIVAIGAAVMIPVSSGRIDNDRAELAKHCMTLLLNDSCTAKAGEQPAAQSLSDSIATWKAVELGAKIGVGVGLATVVLGIIVRYRDGAEAAPPQATLLLDQQDGRLRLGLAWALRF
jgi:hypothetical protein